MGTRFLRAHFAFGELAWNWVFLVFFRRDCVPGQVAGQIHTRKVFLA
jgi:hypothetical protein